MRSLLLVARMGLALLVLAVALLVLPISMAWSAVQTGPGVNSTARPQAWAQPLDQGLNLYRMQPDLYRSALPTAAAQPLIKALGVATVINFYQRTDAAWLHDPQIRQVHLPLRTDRIDDSDVLEALRNIRQAQARGPVLIHCKHGQNRTGLIAALYRVVYQGWSKQQALAEMRGGGFGGEQRMGDAERYLAQVDIARLQTALSSGACNTSPWDLCMVKAWFAEGRNG
ncbi:MAG: dual specificity protein phosphatase family protein [Pseudomonas sp.]|uniref:dual specificity protein phosphatase family protein n=1 Tax=Pseudomonas sp. TaxID=306 RepID=UPI00271FC49E|nr:dual specificity protein phosphatase family protein [Pseudomonas sp.]MDO9620135.1 dual specificity protein phosphatase family protein [Pseudomonas sp.]MDP2447266.1 dual specificity protein phosphatase family protein [Pseudomonas sp.]MDZ4337925.1 dual specificity protein phosphatase family protein [Pseudomonas sp.]